MVAEQKSATGEYVPPSVILWDMLEKNAFPWECDRCGLHRLWQEGRHRTRDISHRLVFRKKKPGRGSGRGAEGTPGVGPVVPIVAVRPASGAQAHHDRGQRQSEVLIV